MTKILQSSEKLCGEGSARSDKDRSVDSSMLNIHFRPWLGLVGVFAANLAFTQPSMLQPAKLKQARA
jgi:hypothetical protein